MHTQLPYAGTACKCGAMPKLYRDARNQRVEYFLECAPCAVRSPSRKTRVGAARAWERGEAVPIPHTTAASAA
ncbi:MAG TPA: hypothetical protein VFG73_02470 [Rhodanobacteraceae bacterium]|nr:hypothetical protein [Rhodanobacteraceae bacterium]